MSEQQPAGAEMKTGRCMKHNLAEKRAACLVEEETSSQIQKRGHKGILTLNEDSKLESATTYREHFDPPKGTGVIPRSLRREHLEKHLTLMISEQIQAEKVLPPVETNYISTTQSAFCAGGFEPVLPEPAQGCDYRSEEAITFWSENHHQIQGATAVHSLEAPFRKSAKFSTPISERLDEPEPLPDD